MHFLKSLSFLIFTLVIHFFSLKLIATTHWNDQQAIQEVEERIVLNCRSSENFTFRQNAAQSLVDNVQNNTQQFVAPVIIWTTQKLSSILSNMFWIHDRKLRNRLTTNHHSTYTTGFVRGTVFLQGGESDPCPT